MRSSTPAPTHGSASPGRSHRRPLARRAASALAVLAAAAVAALSLTTAPALADDCPNTALRVENNSTQLPDCRAYELVTSPYKEGFAPGAPVYTDDGAAFAYLSAGTFAGNGVGGTNNQYVATRSATGWTTVAPTPSWTEYTNINATGAARAMSADLRSTVWQMVRPGESSELADFYLRSVDGAFTRIGPALNPATRPPSSASSGFTGIEPNDVAASTDLSHLMFTVNESEIFPGTGPGAQFNLYEFSGTGNDRPKLVSVDNSGTQIEPGCDAFAGSRTSAYRAMSMDGRVIFATVTADCLSGSGSITQTWARVGGTTSYHVSASQCTRTIGDPGGVCNATANSVFEGADADGTRVFFTTNQQLVNGDTDQTSDLYACDIPSGTPAPVGAANSCSTLREVSGAASDANVQGVVRVSDDGSRVYFVAQGVLAANHGANDAAAVAGDENLYVWHEDAAHPAGQTTFVGKLDPNDGTIGGPALWVAEGGGGRMAQTTDDGRFLVLSTYSPLVDSGPSADTDAAADVYRYDADTGALVRLSASTSGDAGNDSSFDATLSPASYPASLATARSRNAMTDDARTVVFRTSEALSPDDTNGTVDVYAWHDGKVSLISSGRPNLDGPLQPPTAAFITSSGNDIYFSTTANLTDADGDTQVDFYDARVDGGFAVAKPATPCTSDGCHGNASPPPSPSVPSSSEISGSADVPAVVPAFVLRTISAADRKKLASSGRLTVRVAANTASILRAKATATIGHKSANVASARRSLAASGLATLSLKLSKAARAQLATTSRLTVKIVVNSSKVAVAKSVTLKLTMSKHKSASKKSERSSLARLAASRKGGRS